MQDLPKDYFKVLGLTREDVKQPDCEKRVRSAFRRLAKDFHPDTNFGSPAAAEKFKVLNEANNVLSDSEKRVKYVEMIDELGLGYGNSETEVSYKDILGDLQLKLPKIGVDRSWIATKDLMDALRMFYQGMDVAEINTSIGEISMAWKLDVYEENTGVPKILFLPYLFLEDRSEDAYLHPAQWEVYAGRSGKPVYIEPNAFVDIRHITRGESFGSLSNVALGTIKNSDWQSIIDAAGYLAGYQSGWKIPEREQTYAKNVCFRIARAYKDLAFFDEVFVPKQNTGTEGQYLLLEAPVSRS